MFWLVALAILLVLAFRWRGGRVRGVALPELPPADAPQREGGLPDWPIVVGSAAQVEPRASRERCPHCGGELKFGEHEAIAVAGRRLRRVRLRCTTCGNEVLVWFTLEPGSGAH